MRIFRKHSINLPFRLNPLSISTLNCTPLRSDLLFGNFWLYKPSEFSKCYQASKTLSHSAENSFFDI